MVVFGQTSRGISRAIARKAAEFDGCLSYIETSIELPLSVSTAVSATIFEASRANSWAFLLFLIYSLISTAQFFHMLKPLLTVNFSLIGWSSEMVKNRAVVAKKGPKTKKSLLNPLIRELYKVTGKILSGIFCLNFRLADIKKETSFEEIVKLGGIIEGKEGSFLAPSYNVNRVDAANELIAHLRTQVGSSEAC